MSWVPAGTLQHHDSGANDLSKDADVLQHSSQLASFALTRIKTRRAKRKISTGHEDAPRPKG
ncbi:MAG: hypothetical protein ACOH10_11230 [Rhodoglobus sp.]